MAKIDFFVRKIRVILERLPHPLQRHAFFSEYYFRGKIQGAVTLSQVQYSVFPTGEPGVLQAIRERGVFAYLGNKPEQSPVADGRVAKRHKNGKGFSIGRKLAVLELAAVSPCYKAGSSLDGEKLNLYPFRNVYNGLTAVSIVGIELLLDGEIVSEVDVSHGALFGKYYLALDRDGVIGAPVPKQDVRRCLNADVLNS